MISEEVMRSGRVELVSRFYFQYFDKNTQQWKSKGKLFTNEIIEIARMTLRAIKWICERKQIPYPQDLESFTQAFQNESSTAFPVSEQQTIGDTVSPVGAIALDVEEFNEP